MTRLVATAVFVLAALLPGTPAAEAAPTSSEHRLVDELVRYMNRERLARNLPPLDVEPYAVGRAQEWAEHMRATGSLRHSDFNARFSQYPARGENIGMTPSGTGHMHRLFMSSGEHRRNILQPGFDAVGVGVACGGDGRMWVVVDFVARTGTVAAAHNGAIPPASPVTVGDQGGSCSCPGVVYSGTPGTGGYWMVGADGGIFAFGDVGFHGSTGGTRLNSPIVAMAPAAGRDGYWLAAADGGVFNFGSARFHGSMGGTRLNQPVVGVAARPQSDGYWLVARDGGIFAFGNARFHGSMGGTRLNQAMVGMASTREGTGYWTVAADGGVFSFGNARFHGSMGGTRLNQPIVGMASTESGRGYWLVARDGGVFAFGDARFHGSTGGMRLNQPIVVMARTPSGNGYWLVARDGGVFAFGDAAFRGSMGGACLNQPVVGGAA